MSFCPITLNEPAVQSKGMALFPGKVNGHSAMSDYATTCATSSLDEVLAAME
jgi:hypothetical protein